MAGADGLDDLDSQAGILEDRDEAEFVEDSAPASGAGGPAAGDGQWDGNAGPADEAVPGRSDGPDALPDPDQLRAEEDQDSPYNPLTLPEQHCCFCGIHEPSSLVKCTKTGKWFCNNHVVPGGSCIVQHLVRGQYKEVTLHPDSQLGGEELCCYNCRAKNIFVLGFLRAKAEDVVLLLCRSCLTLGKDKDDWALNSWQPLIHERALLDWLVPPSPDACLKRAWKLLPEQVVALEELWRTDPNATLQDLGKEEAAEQPVDPALLKYEDAFHYQNTLGPLVALEAEADRRAKERLAQDDIAVTWGTSVAGRRTVQFKFGRADEEHARVVPGDEMRISIPVAAAEGGQWSVVGRVSRAVDAIVTLELRDSDSADCPSALKAGFRVEAVWKSVSFDRMQKALRTLALEDGCMSGYLHHTLLGHHVPPPAMTASIPADLAVPNLPELNNSQETAVRAVLGRSLSLIQGPPGTGKTVTSAAIVYHLVQRGAGQVLVTAPSNVAVDHLTAKIARTGVRVVRIMAKTREGEASEVEHLCLHNMLHAVGGDQLKQLAEKRNASHGQLSRGDESAYQRLVNAATRKVLDKAQVICCTCAGAGDARLRTREFRMVLVDEATQAHEPEVLIPLVKKARQAVLVGDHCQLGPVVMCKQAARAGLSLSLFERLLLLDIRPLRLQVQYRMHPCLSEFPSNMFYEGTLQNGVSVADRTPQDLELQWPVPGLPMFFYVSTSAEEISGSGTSFLNRGEASAVERLVTTFLRQGINGSKVGVITPYEGQRSYLTSFMERHGALPAERYSTVEVASVDSFQGREKDFIIVSCVRSNERGGIGFLADPRRLNVSLTRAKYGLVVVGNPGVLAKQVLWNHLLHHFKERNCLVEGQLSGLRPSAVHIPRPRRYINPRYQLYMHSMASGAGMGEQAGHEEADLTPAAAAAAHGGGATNDAPAATAASSNWGGAIYGLAPVPGVASAFPPASYGAAPGVEPEAATATAATAATAPAPAAPHVASPAEHLSVPNFGYPQGGMLGVPGVGTAGAGGGMGHGFSSLLTAANALGGTHHFQSPAMQVPGVSVSSGLLTQSALPTMHSGGVGGLGSRGAPGGGGGFPASPFAGESDGLDGAVGGFGDQLGLHRG